MGFPYERIVQWLSGPVAILSGWLAVQITNHFNIFGTLGIGRVAIAHAIFSSVVFAVGALVTYAGHHKWLDNLPKWWTQIQKVIPATGANVGTGSGVGADWRRVGGTGSSPVAGGSAGPPPHGQPPQA